MQVIPISLGFVNAYLIDTGAGLVLVDTGTAGHQQAILSQIQAHGGSLKLILITHAHADHYGSAPALKQASGAPVAIHRLDAPVMASGRSAARLQSAPMRALFGVVRLFSHAPTLQADLLLEDGQRLDSLGLAGRVVLTPGHSAGSCCLLLDDGSLFTGDLVSANGKAHLQRAIVEDWDDLRASYQRLRALDAQKVYVGHGNRVLNGSELNQTIDQEIGLIHA